ncbi:recombinase family protein [Streptomyces sp. CC228A]|uniref:recombinase family protein n=1 Tax=Streptomyces sp. CC228A TaxID=2898186 RepID=UPI001F44E999|nr:recombinase family protein [Streptomyces sp. CC228A]
MRRAVVYARQSEARKDKSEGSTITQVAECTALINKADDLKHTATYEDIDLSAYSGVERPDFERMLGDARSGLIDVIVVNYISRFSRQEPKDALPVILELQRLGVQIVSVYEGPITDDLVGLITLLMRLNAAHEESKNKSKAVSGTKKTLKAAGGFVGGVPPFGFRTEVHRNGKLTIRVLVHEPDEVSIIRKIVARILEHKDVPYVPGKSHPGSLTGVCAWLNETGVPTRGIESHAKRGIAAPSWKVTTVRRVLTDPRLMGHLTEPVYETVQKRDGSGTWQRRTGYRSVRDEHGKPVISHEPIIGAADFHELQKCLAVHKEGSKPKGTLLTRGDSLLSALGILRCEGGHTMCKQAGDSPRMTTYTCQRKKGTKSTHEGTVSILRDRLDDYVARSVMSRLVALDYEDPGDMALLTEATRRFAATVSAPETVAEKSAIVAERADYKAALDELYDDYDAGVYKGATGRERFIQKRDRLEASLSAVDERLAALEAETPQVLSVDIWTAHEGDPIGPGSWWHGATLADKRAFLKLFVERVEVRKASAFGTQYAPDPVNERARIHWAKPGGSATI